MTEVVERFLRYVSYDTQSEHDHEEVPSTTKQFELAKLLAKELEEMGCTNARYDEHCYVYAEIPSNQEKETLALGFVAHMDTATELPGKDVKPQFVENYDGGDICLNKELDVWMRVKNFPYLAGLKGKTLITTDGTTLLGADDKAGIAEIMAMANYLIRHPEVKHGKICIGFTPDEEVGGGPRFFDVKGFGADVAYTVDGGPVGSLDYENFNAAAGRIIVHGAAIHPGSSKNKMVHAARIAMEFESLLPEAQKPMYTEMYEGFIHMTNINGNVEKTVANYIIRDHDAAKFEQKKELFRQAGAFLNAKYGEGTVEVIITETYRNMAEIIAEHMDLIDNAKKVLEDMGITPVITPIRGGTDGATFSYMGLPCPNLGTGGYNAHGKYEFVPVESLETTVEILLGLVKAFA